MIVFWRVHCTFPPTIEHVDRLLFCVFRPKLCILWTYYKMGCWCNLIRLALTRLITITNKERLRSLKPLNEPDLNRKIVSFRSGTLPRSLFLLVSTYYWDRTFFHIFFVTCNVTDAKVHLGTKNVCPAKTSSMWITLLG